jgi:hypothetical protein
MNEFVLPVDELLGVLSMTKTMLTISNAFQSAGASPYQYETSSPGLTRSILVSRSSMIGGSEPLLILKKSLISDDLENEDQESIEQNLASIFAPVLGI